MPAFSQDSFSKLSTCHIDLQALFFEVIKSFDCIVVTGHRNQLDQEAAYKAGNTQLHYPYGKHNSIPSMAVDVYPVPLNYHDIHTMLYFGGYVMGIAWKLKDEGKITHSIKYGADWNQDKKLIATGFVDAGHFEIIT